MKKYVFLAIIISIATTLGVSAQERQGKEKRKPKSEQREQDRKTRFEEFKAKRVAYITAELSLTEKEAQAFWPICNELQEKRFELNKANRTETQGIHQRIRNKETISNDDYIKIIKGNLDIKIKEAELDKVYFEKMMKVLPVEKVFKYQRAEQRFAQKMFERRDRN